MTGLLRLQVLGPGEGLHVSDEGGAAQGSRPCAPREDGGAGAARETEKSLLRRLRDFLPDVFDTSWARSQWRQAWRVKL